MIGDVNLYFTTPTRAEIELMIAEPSARTRREGFAALSLMLWYATTRLGGQEVFARVSDKNAPSLRLFRDKIGWVETERSEFFGETTLEARGKVLDKVVRMADGAVMHNFDEVA
ncbi:hypothetical protein PhCBS80983_g06207 [Powellomyces hirtus]|uniref:N-acetyltransferase domain-containing protein n=1 Tax=Powellomyces hirtus TaxID=109895 RepID=A0A507DPY0_9FUNG|nr:hypothetical protein PhCBS80983_g06207 [Powellomyces hirtus]